MLSIVMKAPGATLGFSIPTDLISDPLIGELSRLASCHADSLAELETTAVESPLSSQLDEDLVHDLESLDLGGRPWGVIFQDGHPRGLCRISGAESHGPSIHMHFADDDGTPAPQRVTEALGKVIRGAVATVNPESMWDLFLFGSWDSARHKQYFGPGPTVGAVQHRCGDKLANSVTALESAGATPIEDGTGWTLPSGELVHDGDWFWIDQTTGEIHPGRVPAEYLSGLAAKVS